MEEKQYSVGANLLQELVNYLGTRPYAEVGGLVNKIMTLANQQSPQGVTEAAPVAEQAPAATVEAVEPVKKRGRRKLAVVAEENNGTAKS